MTVISFARLGFLPTYFECLIDNLNEVNYVVKSIVGDSQFQIHTRAREKEFVTTWIGQLIRVVRRETKDPGFEAGACSTVGFGMFKYRMQKSRSECKSFHNCNLKLHFSSTEKNQERRERKEKKNEYASTIFWKINMLISQYNYKQLYIVLMLIRQHMLVYIRIINNF